MSDGISKGARTEPLRLLLQHLYRRHSIRTRGNVAHIDIDAARVSTRNTPGGGARGSLAVDARGELQCLVLNNDLIRSQCCGFEISGRTTLLLLRNLPVPVIV